MFKKFFFSFAALLSLPFVLNAKIIETNEIMDILEEIDEDTLVLFDMDDTLTDSSISLGTGAWRQYVRSQIASDYDTKAPGNPHDLMAHATAQNIPVKPVEPNLVTLIENLQDKHIAVFCLTGRGYSMWYSTPMEGIGPMSVRQLDSIEIDFTETTVPKSFQSIDPTILYHGVFLTSGTKKGPFLEKLFQETGYRPTKVVFIDDKLEENKSVESTLDKLGIDNVCVWYHRAQANNQEFNPLIASVQLEAFLNNQTILSDEEAQEKAETLKEIDPDEFFKRLIAIHFPKEPAN
ncbi:MAG: DUF2608 domain-containing protein [Verrucomicrobia bacterium]|nr:DUF2608 domain-containing protein [Verrucomicrobiota bacterium]